MKARPVIAIILVQFFLLLTHFFLYWTWMDFGWPMSRGAVIALRIGLAILSLVFVPASLLGFRYTNPAVRIFYWCAALWMGLANFLFVGAWLAWLADLVLRIAVSPRTRIVDRPYIATGLLAAAVATFFYGLVNARMLRVRHVTVELPRLPPGWRQKRALLISDLHLGHINGVEFARHIAAKARELNPDIIFLAGDVFDGSKVDAGGVAAPLMEMRPPLGVFFVEGNHEVFGGAEHFEKAMREGGICVLHNQSVDVEGVRIIGMPYGNSHYPLHNRAFLEGLHLTGGAPSILLHHVPNGLPIAEHAGVSLQLSGHTHGGGQMFPYNLITRRAFGKFTYGLQRFGDMQVYTSSGAGTWGPPIRVGTHAEIVLLNFA